MRFMMLMYPGIDTDAESWEPSAEDVEAKEVVGGYWLIQASSKEEAVEWASRCPGADGDFIEVRRVYEMEDFPEDVQEAGKLSERPPEQT